MTHPLSKKLRKRACPAGLPWTAEDPAEDHGHTDCWLYHCAADELDRLSPPEGYMTIFLPQEIVARWSSTQWHEWGDVMEKYVGRACSEAMQRLSISIESTDEPSVGC